VFATLDFEYIIQYRYVAEVARGVLGLFVEERTRFWYLLVPAYAIRGLIGGMGWRQASGECAEE
jgi:hypothetical protein